MWPAMRSKNDWRTWDIYDVPTRSPRDIASVVATRGKHGSQMKLGINGRAMAVEEPGGAIQTARTIARGLCEEIDDTTLYGHESLQQTGIDCCVRAPLYPIKSLPYGIVWERTVLPITAMRDGIDVLYCPNTNAPITPTSFSTVMVVHDMGPERGYQSRLQQTYRRATLSPAAKYSDAIVTVSKFSKDEIVDILDVSPGKVHVVYPGIDELFFENGSGSRLDLPEQYVLFVGSMNPRKNIMRAVEAFQRARRQYGFPHEFVLIGPGSSLSFGDDSLDFTENHITSTGFVSTTELKYAYENADLFLFPSLYEGFGLPPVEAMACGTPVLAGAASALPEVLGDAAEYVDPTHVSEIACSIGELLNSAERRESMTRMGLNQSRNYTWERTIDRTHEILESVQ